MSGNFLFWDSPLRQVVKFSRYSKSVALINFDIATSNPKRSPGKINENDVGEIIMGQKKSVKKINDEGNEEECDLDKKENDVFEGKENFVVGSGIKNENLCSLSIDQKTVLDDKGVPLDSDEVNIAKLDDVEKNENSVIMVKEKMGKNEKSHALDRSEISSDEIKNFATVSKNEKLPDTLIEKENVVFVQSERKNLTFDEINKLNTLEKKEQEGKKTLQETKNVYDVENFAADSSRKNSCASSIEKAKSTLNRNDNFTSGVKRIKKNKKEECLNANKKHILNPYKKGNSKCKMNEFEKGSISVKITLAMFFKLFSFLWPSQRFCFQMNELIFVFSLGFQ